jgi:hypothetical protein
VAARATARAYLASVQGSADAAAVSGEVVTQLAAVAGCVADALRAAGQAVALWPGEPSAEDSPGAAAAAAAAARVEAAARAVRSAVRAAAATLADLVDSALDDVLGPAAPAAWADALVREGLEGIRAVHLAAELFVPLLLAAAV